MNRESSSGQSNTNIEVKIIPEPVGHITDIHEANQIILWWVAEARAKEKQLEELRSERGSVSGPILITEAPPEVSMQNLIDAGLNAFGLQLFVESIANMKDAATFKPITFKFRGIRITMQPDGDIDTRHH